MALPLYWPVLVPYALRAPAPVNLGVRLFIKSIDAMRMTCKKCATIKQFSIPSPSKLTEAIRYCKELVASGTLIQSIYWPNIGLASTQMPFNTG